MTLTEALYSLEHKLLPDWFYSSPQEFIGVVASQPNALHSIMSEICSRGEIDNPFRVGEFSVEPSQVNENVAMLHIKFPKPPATPLCISAHVIFDKTFKNICYYTVEKGDETTGGFPAICSWDKDGNHVNYGSESHDQDDCMVKCVTLYMERFMPDDASE